LFYRVQIVVDLFILTCLLHYAGGIENPFRFFYVFHAIIASILLPKGHAFFEAALAIFLLSSLTILEHLGVIAHYPLLPTAPQSIYLLGDLIAFAATLMIAVYLSSAVVDRLREREAELEVAWEEISKVEAMKSQFMLMAGHELRSPIAAIETILEALLATFPDTLKGSPKELIQRAIERLEAMVDLTRDLSELARQHSVKRHPKPTTSVELGTMVRQTAQFYAPQAKKKGIELSVGRVDHLTVAGDPQDLEYVLNNLLSNAIRYTEEGYVQVSLTRGKDAALLEVMDTGIGISAEDQKHLFEDFYRTPKAKKLSSAGTGLGLSIAKAIVERHQGTLSVQSEEGGGSVFRAQLPLGVSPPG
jgi:signal transduction histidine kinase